ncbi:Ethylene-forming enzyme [Hibiscus syriacus]|uniref:Ethylene-forming enzyme n=1 Tax=Hibiscus syriacus TaxID=106335 RepID=A0A6A3CTY6_HIBSY|nr:Ethylene-forming enzyme [Hibiscus syriacus]
MESIVIERRITKWKHLKQRLGLKSMAMGCCGATWNPRPRISTISILDEEEQTPPTQQLTSRFNAVNSATVPLLVGRRQRRQNQAMPTITSATGMNLAMALAAERNLRGDNDNVGPSPTDQVKTLRRLIEETEGRLDTTEDEKE